MRRLPLVAVLTLLTLLWAAPTASAHARLTGSDPAEGAQVAAVPAQLALTFSEPIDPTLATVTVTGADGTEWTVGTITATDATLAVPVTPAGPAGQYTIAYRITSADSDPISGEVRFTMTTAVPAPTTTTTTTLAAEPTTSAPRADTAAQPADPGDGGLPVWVWIVLGLAVVAVVVMVAFAVQRGGSRSGGE